jgi:hypothetical protein
MGIVDELLTVLPQGPIVKRVREVIKRVRERLLGESSLLRR